jgi:hypothetical protein
MSLEAGDPDEPDVEKSVDDLDKEKAEKMMVV